MHTAKRPLVTRSNIGKTGTHWVVARRSPFAIVVYRGSVVHLWVFPYVDCVVVESNTKPILMGFIICIFKLYVAKDVFSRHLKVIP
jgi:hypothetical protein